MSPVTVPGRAALRNAIFEKNLSQSVVARRVGMSDARLSRIIRGFLDPTTKERRALVALLGVPADDLFPGEEDA